MSLPNNLQLCRLCLFEKNSYVDIFEMNLKHGFRIADVINEMLELDVSPGDGFPDRICHDCLNEMARFKRFKNLCQEAKLTLKYIIALATGAMPPPTTLPSFLTAANNSSSDSKKGDSTSLTPSGQLQPSPSSSSSQSLGSSVQSPSTLQATNENPSLASPPTTKASLNSAVPLSVLTPPSTMTPSSAITPSSAMTPSCDVTPSCTMAASAAMTPSCAIAPATATTPSCTMAPSSSVETVNTCVQVNLEDCGSQRAISDTYSNCQITQPHSQMSEAKVDDGEQSVSFADAQEDSDIENLCDEPLPVEAVLSEPDSEVDHGNRTGEVIPVMSQNGEREDSFGMFPISSIINDLHQFSSYIPPGTRIEHSIFDKQKEPEVVDLVDDEDDEDNRHVGHSVFPLVQTLMSSCNESSSSRQEGSDNSVTIKTEGNEDSDLENMCEHPLPVETVLSEPDGDVGNLSQDIKCESSEHISESRDDSFGLFSLTSNFGDLMTPSADEGSGCFSRSQHPVVNTGQLPTNSNEVVAGPLENPNKYPFWCHICGKNFMRKDKLKQHSVVHSNERPFICRICGCSYKRKDKLTSHVTSSHLQHLPHQCDICGKRFVRKDKLKQHSVVHSNRRPHVCKLCDKRYKSKTELKKHEKRIHQ